MCVCDSPCLSMRNNAPVEHLVAEGFISDVYFATLSEPGSASHIHFMIESGEFCGRDENFSPINCLNEKNRLRCKGKETAGQQRFTMSGISDPVLWRQTKEQCTEIIQKKYRSAPA